MVNTTKKLIISGIVILLTLSVFVGIKFNVFKGLSAAPEEIIIGIFPRRDVSNTIAMFQPLADHISEKINHPVRLETAKTFLTFWKRVKQQRYHLVHYNQLHYILSEEEQGYEAIAKNSELGSASIQSMITVNKNSDIKSLADLKGKNVAFGGGKLAMVSYVANRVALRENGLKDTDYQWEFIKNPPKAVISAYERDVDAAGVGRNTAKFPMVTKAIGVDSMKEIYVGEEMPHLPWAVSDDLPEELVDKIKEVLLSLSETSEGKNVLKQAKLSNILPASDKEYDGIREIYAKYKSGN